MALDRWSKNLIVDTFDLYESVTVLPVLDITRLHNTGAAFSFLAGASGWQRWFFISLGIIVSGVILVWLRRLPARQRECLVLRHYEDMSESEIAESLGVSVGSVRTHVHRGMQALTTHLEEAS